MIDRLAEAADRAVSRETFDKIEHFAHRLGEEARSQNLVSAASLADLWERHIVDSAQLARFAPSRDSSWADIGAGAGLPGIVIALLVDGPVTLIEPRRLRADFLSTMVDELGLASRVNVAAQKAQRIAGQFDVITARAVARLDHLLEISTHLSTKNSVWVLPKGRNARTELDEARRSWHIDATSVPSRTDPRSEILVLRRVSAKGKR